MEPLAPPAPRRRPFRDTHTHRIAISTFGREIAFRAATDAAVAAAAAAVVSMEAALARQQWLVDMRLGAAAEDA